MTGSFATGSCVVPVVRPTTGAGAGAIVRESVRLCERVLMIDVVVLEGLRVVVRAMVEWFESKGVGDIPVEYRQQSQSKKGFSSFGILRKTMNTKLNSKYRYFHDTGTGDTVWLPVASHRLTCTGLYMNGSGSERPVVVIRLLVAKWNRLVVGDQMGDGFPFGCLAK